MRLVILALLLASSAAQAQMSLRPGDGFEDCPSKAYPNLALSLWDTALGTFPHSGVNQINVPFNGSLGLLFFAPQSPLSGQFQGLPRGQNIGEMVIGLSSCPGAYPGLPAACLSAIGTSPTLDWTTDVNGTGCQLIPGQGYYLNLSFGSATAPGQGEPWCASTCELSLQSTPR